MARKTKSKGRSNSRVVLTMHPDAAGVDIGSEEIFVAVPAERDGGSCAIIRDVYPRPVRSSRTAPGADSGDEVDRRVLDSALSDS